MQYKMNTSYNIKGTSVKAVFKPCMNPEGQCKADSNNTWTDDVFVVDLKSHSVISLLSSSQNWW